MSNSKVLSSEVKEKFLDIFFPPRCAICDEVLITGSGHICSKCRSSLKLIKAPTCYKCGKEVANESVEYCDDCLKRPRSYVKGFPVYKYVPPLTDSIMALKYAGKKEYAEFFADAIYDRYKMPFGKMDIDALVPVPINKSKFITRGYNQAELIAEFLGKKMNIPVKSDIIDRVSDTKAQKGLTPEQREHNLHTAFAAVRKTDIRTVLLVDDIYTTGATIEACTRALMDAGVDKVYYTSVAIGEGY